VEEEKIIKGEGIEKKEVYLKLESSLGGTLTVNQKEMVQEMMTKIAYQDIDKYMGTIIEKDKKKLVNNEEEDVRDLINQTYGTHTKALLMETVERLYTRFVNYTTFEYIFNEVKQTGADKQELEKKWNVKLNEQQVKFLQVMREESSKNLEQLLRLM